MLQQQVETVNRFSKQALLADAEEFGRFYDHYQPRMFSYIVSRIGSVDDAHDLVSTTFEKAFRNLNTYNESKAAISTWLFSIANNVIIDYQRRESTKKKVDVESLVRTFETNRMSERDLCRLEVIFNLLAELPVSYQEILTLKYIEGFSNKEIAEILGYTTATLATKISRALRALRNRLGQVQPELSICDECDG